MLKDRVSTYFDELPESSFPEAFKNKATVLLSGSAGWGINEGSDEKADWDLHILLSNEDYATFVKQYGAEHVVDDHEHNPDVFGLIRSLDWLNERLSGRKMGSYPLYLWIYTRGQFVRDNLRVSDLVESYQEKFTQDLPSLIQEHFVTFSVRRFDTGSSAKRGLVIASGLNCGEMVKAALQSFSLLNGQPYPYNKWLAKHVQTLGPDGERLVELCEACSLQSDLTTLTAAAKELRDFMESYAREKLGDKRWISQWWEFLSN